MTEPYGKNPDPGTMIKYRDDLRREWREIRDIRIKYKISIKETQDKFTYAGKRQYLLLKKRQKTLSKLIRHVERKISRRMNGQNQI